MVQIALESVDETEPMFCHVFTGKKGRTHSIVSNDVEPLTEEYVADMFNVESDMLTFEFSREAIFANYTLGTITSCCSFCGKEIRITEEQAAEIIETASDIPCDECEEWNSDE